MPFKALADRLAAPFSEALDEIARGARTEKRNVPLPETTRVWIPALAEKLPGARRCALCPVAFCPEEASIGESLFYLLFSCPRRLANSQVLQDILIHDPAKARPSLQHAQRPPSKEAVCASSDCLALRKRARD